MFSLSQLLFRLHLKIHGWSKLDGAVSKAKKEEDFFFYHNNDQWLGDWKYFFVPSTWNEWGIDIQRNSGGKGAAWGQSRAGRLCIHTNRIIQPITGARGSPDCPSIGNVSFMLLLVNMIIKIPPMQRLHQRSCWDTRQSKEKSGQSKIAKKEKEKKIQIVIYYKAEE